MNSSGSMKSVKQEQDKVNHVTSLGNAIVQMINDRNVDGGVLNSAIRFYEIEAHRTGLFKQNNDGVSKMAFFISLLAVGLASAIVTGFLLLF